MQKVKRIIISIICVIIVIFSIFLLNINSPLIVYPKKEYKQVLSVWQIDTFSGGKGSRTAFLRKVANAYSKKHPEVLFLVVNHTLDSATKSISEGKIPDLISYGGNGLTFVEKFVKLKNYDVLDGDYNNDRYAVSWCKGGYFAIKKGNGEKNIIQDVNGGNIYLALTEEQDKLENFEICSEDYAYSLFLRTNNATLYGNQRNIVRLVNSGINFTSTPLTYFNDMFQYISITSTNGEKIAFANTFIDYLLSEEVQKKLVDISMFSVNGYKLYNDNEHFSQFENQNVKYTISPFLQTQTLDNVKIQSKESFISKKNNKDLANYLK